MELNHFYCDALSLDISLKCLQESCGDVRSITQVILYLIVSGKLNQVHLLYLKHFPNAFPPAFAFNSVRCSSPQNGTAGIIDPLS